MCEFANWDLPLSAWCRVTNKLSTIAERKRLALLLLQLYVYVSFFFLVLFKLIQTVWLLIRFLILINLPSQGCNGRICWSFYFFHKHHNECKLHKNILLHFIQISIAQSIEFTFYREFGNSTTKMLLMKYGQPIAFAFLIGSIAQKCWQLICIIRTAYKLWAKRQYVVSISGFRFTINWVFFKYKMM